MLTTKLTSCEEALVNKVGVVELKASKEKELQSLTESSVHLYEIWFV